MVFPKKSCWNIFLVLLGKMIFIFRENIILLFRRKMKDEWKYDIFFKCCEKMIFPKKSHWNMTFLVILSGKKIFLFPENMILFFRRTMKDDLSQKNTWKYIFFKCPEKMVFPKKIALFGWRYSTMKNLQYLVSFSPQELYLEVPLSAN